MKEFKIQKQEDISYGVNREDLEFVYDFNTKEKKPKQRGSWRRFFQSLPGEIVVKNSVLTNKSFTIYACHSKLKCAVRVNLSIVRHLLDEPNSNYFEFFGMVRYMDKCICGDDSDAASEDEASTSSNKEDNATAKKTTRKKERRPAVVDEEVIDLDATPECTEPINKENLIKRMKAYKSGEEASILRRFLELRKPFQRFVAPTTSLNEKALKVCNNFNEKWHNVESVEGESESEDHSPTPQMSQFDFGGFLGMNSASLSQSSKKRTATSPLRSRSKRTEKVLGIQKIEADRKNKLV